MFGLLPVALQGLGPFGSPPGILVGLAILALILLVGRFVLAFAWRLVVIGLIVVTTLWILGMLGFQFGIL